MKNNGKEKGQEERRNGVCVEFSSCPLCLALVNVLKLHLTKRFSTLALSEMSH